MDVTRMFRLLICNLLCMPAVAGQAGDHKQEVERIRVGLQAYLSSINAVDFQYRETREEDADSEVYELIKSKQIEAARTSLESADPDLRRRGEQMMASINNRDSQVVTRQCRYTESFPSIRLDVHTRTEQSDGIVKERDYTHIYHEKRRTFVDPATKSIHTKDGIDISVFSYTPVYAIGRKVPGTLNMPITELMRDAELVHVLNRDVVDGRMVTKLLIGPGLLSLGAASGYTDASYIELDVFDGEEVFPKEIRYLEPRGDGAEKQIHERLVVSLHGYETVRGGPAGGGSTPFPRKITFKDSVGVTTLEIQEVALGANNLQSRFSGATPDGYLVYRNDKVPSVTLAGGKGAQRDKLREVSEAAHDLLLDNPPPPRETPWIHTVAIFGVPGIALLVLAALLILRHKGV